MYKIRFNGIKKNYEFDKNNKTIAKGSLTKITDFAIEEGLDIDGLEIAYKTMNKNKHTIAEFGINGYFIFSK